MRCPQAPSLYEGEIVVYQLSEFSIKNKCDKSMSELLKILKESKEILKNNLKKG